MYLIMIDIQDFIFPNLVDNIISIILYSSVESSSNVEVKLKQIIKKFQIFKNQNIQIKIEDFSVNGAESKRM